MYGRDLPSHEQLAEYAPANLSRVYSREGRVVDEFATQRRMYTPPDEIPPLVKHAFISAEDKNFYTHVGFDIVGIGKAVVDAAQGQRLRGASTITQQVMKNFLLTGDRKMERKIKEIILATRLEQTLDKEQILALYLNEIFLGQNSYGITAAAETYFNKTLEELTPGEAAYLASLPKAPSDRHPVRDYDTAVFWRDNTLREMAENGYISSETYLREKELPLKTVQSGDYPSSRSEMPPRDYFTDEIRRQLSDRLGEEKLFTGGLSIRSTMDPTLQAAAAQALRDRLEEYDRGIGIYRGPLETIAPEKLAEDGWRDAMAGIFLPRDIEGWHPAVILEVGETSARIGIDGVEDDEDGHFLNVAEAAWARPRRDGRVQGKATKPADLWSVGDIIMVSAVTAEDGTFEKWTYRQIPELQGAFMAMDTQTGRVLAMQGGFSYQSSVFNRATQATRQPGSSFKPFVYAAALDSGYTPASIVVDAPVEVETGAGIWRPKNSSNKFYGPAPMRTGIEQSRNLMTVRIAQDIGMERVGDYAERFGVYENMPNILSYSLGAGETTLYKMVAAYAMFANGGKRVEPTLVDRVQDRNGNTIYRHDRRECVDCQSDTLLEAREPRVYNNSQQIMDPVTAYQLSSMMRGVVSRGTAASTVGKLGVPISGKTGTTNDSKDAWFVGFTPRIAAGCYIGFDTPRPMGRGAYGGTLCGPVFRDFMEVALEGHGSFDLPRPANTVLVKIDRFTGQRLPDGASGSHVVAELFRAGEEPRVGEYGAYVDGGFVMGNDLLLFERGEVPTETINVQGRTVEVPSNPTFGTMSSGGLY
ncbi:PBP1A family penicillin-binding protein [Rhodobacteraceae bacterium KN286]|uniref:Penicillin-binding protein 1A n=2 Tax=Oceanomicrobium pacificus TaxID=2692916 RepID=A0A6B0TMN8_9RHOB|nr:PBP1A family penicillin-binding protein [Oceanomicrobium pacificus]